MKTPIRIVLLLCFITVSFLFMACPYSTKYPLGEKDLVKIDERLLGSWMNDSLNAEVNLVTITKAGDYLYDVRVDLKGQTFNADTTIFKGWLTSVNGSTFFILQEIKDNVPIQSFFVYHFEMRDGHLISHDISLNVGGTDAVTSTKAYRGEVSASMNTDEFLSSEIVWDKLK